MTATESSILSEAVHTHLFVSETQMIYSVDTEKRKEIWCMVLTSVGFEKVQHHQDTLYTLRDRNFHESSNITLLGKHYTGVMAP